ncbi:MAG: PHP domain-containing protein [Desulfobulbus sp.]|jgi:predicted metal-dependent phosphoesterase TrpH
MCIDLHTHSLYSDGSNTPAELVDLAVRNGLRVLALTDHDTMDGVAELVEAGRQAGLVTLPGVEISTTLRGHTLHLLGYGIDVDDSDLHRWLEPLQEGRVKRNLQILDKLRDLGIDISLEEVQAVSPSGQTGRPHIAQVLMTKGVVGSFSEAFQRYLGKNKSAWAGRFCYTPAEAIAALHRAGGIAVLAHPVQIDQSLRILPAIIAELALRGLDGIECFYPTHTRTIRKKLSAIAQKHGLLITGGSDYHGPGRPNHPLAGSGKGFCPPYALMEELGSRLGIPFEP